MFLVGGCVALEMSSKRANPALKKICWQIMTVQVHILKCIVQGEKQTHTHISSMA